MKKRSLKTDLSLAKKECKRKGVTPHHFERTITDGGATVLKIVGSHDRDMAVLSFLSHPRECFINIEI
jgi:hypothetical protein